MPVHLLDGATPHRCEEEKLKDDEDEKERRERGERERENAYRIIKLDRKSVV